MSELVVKDIYDQLFYLESKVKRDDVYPIHKRLVFDPQDDIKDIYGWLSKEIEFKDGDRVLDAGCGVGFGSCLLAKEHNIEVTGISLSEKEVERARLFAKKTMLESRTKFEQKSFDTLDIGTYHKIIAIESIKHSLNLSKSLEVMKAALLPGGTLYIVEDFYGRAELTPDARSYKQDWKLTDVFRLSDYHKVLEIEKTNFRDLTDHMPQKSMLAVNMKLMVNAIASTFQTRKHMNINKIFRGGYYLDRLYIQGWMRYGILSFDKK
ncbi:MAG: methyltransferase domain-containing protein [Bacteroidota bacterium]